MVELMGLNKWSFPLFEYGERWRMHRRLFHEFFNIATVDRYDEDQRRAASRLLKNLSEHPTDFRRHVKLATGSLALDIAYGIRVDSPDNPYFRAAEEVIEATEPAMIPGAFAAEFFPFRKFPLLDITQCSTPWAVRHFPSWFPGGGARSFGERVYKSSLDSITMPMEYVTGQLKVYSVCAHCNTISELDRWVKELVPL